MPELPEVETIRRQLDAALPGRVLESVAVLDPRLTAPSSPGAFSCALTGRSLGHVGRRGKFLRLALGEGDELVVHLRMTGRLRLERGRPDPERHLRAVFGIGTDQYVALRDQRRFATLTLASRARNGEESWDARLGHEPLRSDFTAARLGDLLDGRRAPIKAALLDQRLIAGIGNIYADEALFLARIDPRRPAGTLSAREVRALHRAIRDRLRAGIAANGASIDSFHDSLGTPGTMQDALLVHLQQARPCRRCGRPITKIRVAQRGTYVCERCQR